MIGLLTIFTTGASVLLASQPVLADNTPHLLSRQISGFDPGTLPSSCAQTKCITFTQDISNCSQQAQQGTQVPCFCSAAVASDLKSCLQCALDAGVTSINTTFAQEVITKFTDTCKAAGYPISVAGVSSGSSGSSASGSATGAASITGAASTTGAASSSTATTAAGSKSSGTLVGVSVGFLGAVVGLAMAGFSL